MWNAEPPARAAASLGPNPWETALRNHPRSWKRLLWALVVPLCLTTACSTMGKVPAPPQSTETTCLSQFHSMLFHNQFEGLPRYVLLATAGEIGDDQLRSNGVVTRISYESKPAVGNCEVLRSRQPYDNPAVDIYRKHNRVRVFLPGQASNERLEFRWTGGLIVAIGFLRDYPDPAVGIEELDPNQSTTRRVIYLDGRKRPLELHIGPFGTPDSNKPKIAAVLG
jgi:hypothetical protein